MKIQTVGVSTMHVFLSLLEAVLSLATQRVTGVTQMTIASAQFYFLVGVSLKPLGNRKTMLFSDIFFSLNRVFHV